MDSSLGIDIGRYSIKLAQVRASSRGYDLIAFQEFLLNQNVAESDRGIEIIDILQNISNQYVKPGVKVVLGMPQNLVSQRLCQFPFKERYKILKSISFELEDHLPFDLNQAILDAKVICYQGTGSQVLATSCLKEHISKQLELAHKGHIDPDFLSVEGLGFSNLFSHWLKDPPENLYFTKDLDISSDEIDSEDSSREDLKEESRRDAELIINLGHSKSTVIFISGISVVDIRGIDWGGQDLIRYIADRDQIQFKDAMESFLSEGQININEAVATPHQKDFSKIIKSAMTDFLKTLQLIILETQSRTNISCREVRLTGGLSKLSGLGPFMTQYLDIPVNRLEEINSSPKVNFQKTAPDHCVAITAVGLALEAFKKPKNPASNLLRGEFSLEAEGFGPLWKKWAPTVKTLSVALFLLLTYSVVRDDLSSSIADISQVKMREFTKKITGLRGRKASLSGAKKYIKDQKRIIKSLKTAEKIQATASALDFLKDLSLDLPTGKGSKIDITYFRLLNDQVKVKGRVANSRDISIIKRKLQSLLIGKDIVSESVVSTDAGLAEDVNLTADKRDWVSFSFYSKSRSSKKKGDKN